MDNKYLRFGGFLFTLVLIFTIWGVSSATPGDSNLVPASDAVWTPDEWIYLPNMSRYYPVDTIFGYEYSIITESHGLELMATAQASWVRRAAIWWPDVEPTKGTYNWSALSGLEQEFLRAHDRSMEVIIVVRGTPDWAQADHPWNETCGRIKRSEFSSFANFMVELVDRCSVAPYHVKYWQIWNEPDIDPRDVGIDFQYMGCWGTRDKLGEPHYEPYYGGGYFAEMLMDVYPAMKTANPNVQVIAGGLLMDCDPTQDIPNGNPPPIYRDCSPSLFFEGILAGGGGPYFDGVGFHAYDYIQTALGEYYNPNWTSSWNTTGPVTLAKASYLQGLLATYNVTGKFLMNTESALLITNAGSPLDCPGADKDICENTKAYYVVQSYVAALAKGLRANIWYFWMWRDSGLFESDLTILPAYNSYKFARSYLKYATYSQEITTYLGDGVRVYELNNQPGRIWVMWSLDGATHNGLVLPGTPLAVYDAFGTAMTPASTIDVDLKPLYLEWNP